MALRHATELPKQAQPGDTLVVIHAFDARSPDELSLIKGERIKLVEKDDDFGDGWYLGEHLTDGRTGLFPEVYTKLAPPAPPGSNTVRTYRSGSAPNAGPNIPPQSAPLATTSYGGSYADDSRVDRQAANAPHPAFSQHYQSTPPPLNTTTTTQRTVSVPSSAYASPTVSSAPPAQRSISLMMEGGHQIEEGSPVLNETLSVIDEHITDMNTPRSSLFQHHQPINDSGSDYSGHPGHRFSYINGNETDEEERNAYTVSEVNRWTAAQVAEFLEDMGVERHHCDVFQDQEITGEVLLNLDQASVFMKEFDLGVVGRRLRTWQKIKSFQDEVRASSRDSTGKRAQFNQTPISEASASTSYSGLPGMRHLRQGSPLAESYTLDHTKGTIRTPNLPTTQEESPNRSPAVSPRTEYGHARRQSSVDAQSKLSQSQLSENFPAASSPTSHNKKPSLDRNWTMSSGGSPAPNRSSFLGVSTRSRGASTVDLETGSDGTRDMDRGYLSGSEVDSRKHRNVLRKRDTAVSTHSRQSSYKEAASTHSNKRHSRFGSAGSFIAATFSGGKSQDDTTIPRLGGEGEKSTTMIGGSPIVTRLDYDSPRNTTASRKRESQAADSSRSSLSQPIKTPVDPATGEPKPASLASTLAGSHLRNSMVKDEAVQSPTGTTSTSETKSLDVEKEKAKAQTPGLTPNSAKKGPFNKKQTSAYTRGLLKKNPRDAMADCDYSGWMKKKAPSLIATWKPRLFVLRGRRLSYYYSENDTEEQGLIDISNHKVLPADDLLTGIHATVTGAKSSPTSPANVQTETMNAAEVAAQPQSSLRGPAHESIFIFKLVPPRAGLSRAVNFTKPTVHYFAVDNVRQGRLWMAALMKATIQMDSTKPMVTTYGQKTISLAKAQQMKQRPPELQDAGENGTAHDEADEHTDVADDHTDIPDDHTDIPDDHTDDAGLNIKGLDMSYEYLAADNHLQTSGNGEPEADAGPTSAPLMNRASVQESRAAAQNTYRGRATASYQEGQNGLRLVRSLSGGLSRQSGQDAGAEAHDADPSESYSIGRSSRPSTSASRVSEGSRAFPVSSHGAGGGSTDATTAARAAMLHAE